MIGQAIRSAAFYLVFLGQTVILAIILGTIALLVKGRTRFSWAIARYWSQSNLFFLRWLTGIRTEVTGMENIPEGGCIIAAKHQSDWDIFAILPHAGRPAYIAKKELMRIPFFGWAAASMDCIEVDRSKGAGAIPEMMNQARAAIARGCRIVIFPEGTRTAPLAEPSYKFGIAKLYEELGVPVVPVALNSGLFWGRNSPILWPGKAQARFLPPIPPGLPASQFQKRLANEIEAATNILILDAVRAGVTRPLTPEFRARVNTLEKENAAASSHDDTTY